MFYKFSLIIILISCGAQAQTSEFVYGCAPQKRGFLEESFYKKAIEVLPIPCVDIFIYNPHEKTYFLTLRKTEPAQGGWFYPGGRIFKGESFFDCARRKCAEEMGLSIDPVALVGVYATSFEKSAWECATHTINIVVCALSTADWVPTIDANHSDYRWVSLDEEPADPYVWQVYHDTCMFLRVRELL